MILNTLSTSLIVKKRDEAQGATLAATADLRDIALFTQRRWGVEQRNLHLKQIDESFWLLAENPDIGRTCDDIRAGYRTLPQGSQVIFYQQIGSHHMKVIRFLHKSFDVTRPLAPNRHRPSRLPKGVPAFFNAKTFPDLSNAASRFFHLLLWPKAPAIAYSLL